MRLLPAFPASFVVLHIILEHVSDLVDANITTTSQCYMATSCVPVAKRECFGATLPYSYTSMVLATDSSTLDDVERNLASWEQLQYVPQCWERVQPLLCSVYMPPCNDHYQNISLPSKELCDVARGPCKIVASTMGWPEFLRCDQPHFQTTCKQETKPLKFNKTGSCLRPLVATEKKESWFPEVDGCGVQCQNPFFTSDEHDQAHTLVGVCVSLCILCNLFTVLTFLIDWSNANRYPALVLFFINICYLIGSFGWLAQFFPGARHDIICRKDGSARRWEPQLGSGESPSCTIVFIVIYYFTMAGMMWFSILTYCWHLMFRAIGVPRDAIVRKKAYFHMVAWTVPLVLTIVCLALQEIESESLSGVCFVAYTHRVYRTVFILIPVAMVMMVGLYFMGRGFITLVQLRHGSPDIVGNKASTKIRNTIIRLGLFMVTFLALIICTFAVHIYMFLSEADWSKSLKDYIVCKAIQSGPSQTNRTECLLESRPSLVAMEIHIIAFFGGGVAMSSWSWNAASFDAWKRFFMRVCNIAQNKPVRLKKHEIIAQAFKQHRHFSVAQSSHVSFSFRSTHDDPLGMRLELNSMSSMEMSSGWAAALPRMMARRGALVHPLGATGRRYSSSDLESVRSSRRYSTDSHMSQPRKKKKRHKKRKHRRRALGGKGRISPMTAAMAFAAASHGVHNAASFSRARNGRRASDTSVWSNTSGQSIQFSVEKVEFTAINTDSNNQEKVIVLPATTRRGSFSGSTERPGTAVPGPKFTSVNASSTSYSIFTASSLLPNTVPNPIELLDLETGCSCTGTDTSCEDLANHQHFSNPVFHMPSASVLDIEPDDVSELSTASC